MRGKVCIVTGANTGIGLETARGLATAGATVVLACRDVAKGERARESITTSAGRDDVVVMRLDLGDRTSVAAFAKAFGERYDRLDVLVDNAGVAPRLRTTTKDGFETTFGVNHLGTARVTLALLDALRAAVSARVVVVSSKMHHGTTMRWDDLQFERRSLGGLAAYKHSKLANVLFAKALARRLSPHRVTVNVVHPGVVATELTREYPRVLTRVAGLFLLKPAQGAECPLHVATAPELDGVSGEYFEASRRARASPEACDEAAQERLWEITEEMLAA
jgi:NAD(P)-dependent dehydrogenase (short-subunit alcohol dehydrogenase family)